MQNQTSLEIFDSRGRFVMPSAAQISTMDAETQKRFRAVQQAATECEAATEAVKNAQLAVSDALAERDDAESDLARMRPKVDPVTVAKQMIASNRRG